jgi:hypothetical protein
MQFKIEYPRPKPTNKKPFIKKQENTRHKIAFYNNKTREVHVTFINKTRKENEKELKEYREYIKTWHESEIKPNSTARCWVLI